MHGEEQQLQIQQPNWQEKLDPQLLSRVKQIIVLPTIRFLPAFCISGVITRQNPMQ